MNARSYWKLAKVEIPDDKTSSLSTQDAIKQCMSNTVLSKNAKKDKMDAMPNVLLFV